MKTTTVYVWRPTAGRDQWGQPTQAWQSEAVSGVLFAPPSGKLATGDDEEMRAGDVGDITFHFPRGFEASLAGCSIETEPVGGERSLWDVLGDPVPYMAANTPGQFTMQVHATRRTAAQRNVGPSPWQP